MEWKSKARLIKNFQPTLFNYKEWQKVIQDTVLFKMKYKKIRAKKQYKNLIFQILNINPLILILKIMIKLIIKHRTI